MCRIFFSSPPAVQGSLTLGWRGLCHSRGALLFYFNALDVHRGSGIPKASPTAVSHPHLMAFFAMELTQGPNLRFPNLHVTQSIKRPQLGAPGGRVAKTMPCDWAATCKGKVVAKCYSCDWAALCATHKDGLCVPCQEGEEPEGGGEEGGGEDPNGVRIEQCAQCLLPVGTTTGHFLLIGGGVGGRWLPPSLIRRWGGVAGHPDPCLLAKVCHGEALPWHTLQGHVAIKVPAGTILVVRKGMYGGVARVPQELEGVAQVVEWRQVQEYAAVTDFVWLRRMTTTRRRRAKACAHVARCEKCPLHPALTSALTSYCGCYRALTGCSN